MKEAVVRLHLDILIGNLMALMETPGQNVSLYASMPGLFYSAISK